MQEEMEFRPFFIHHQSNFGARLGPDKQAFNLSRSCCGVANFKKALWKTYLHV